MELVVGSSDSNSSETIENSVGVLFFSMELVVGSSGSNSSETIRMPAPEPAVSVCFTEACNQLRQKAVHVSEAGRELRRARNQINELRRKMRQEWRQTLTVTESAHIAQQHNTALLQAAVDDRANKQQTLQETLKACDECMRVVQNCNPKPDDWKVQVAKALVRT
jgi:hypothetical protein